MEPREITPEEFDDIKRAAHDAGYGNGPDDPTAYHEYEIINGAIAPGWMAELFARLPLTTDEES